MLSLTPELLVSPESRVFSHLLCYSKKVHITERKRQRDRGRETERLETQRQKDMRDEIHRER